MADEPIKVEEIKPGYKTTEFWLSAAAVVVGLVLASGLADDSIVVKVAGLASSLLGSLGYSWSRASVKS